MSIQQLAGLYNTYPTRQIPVVSAKESVQPESKNAISDVSTTPSGQNDALEQEEKKASRNADLSNISLTFNAGEDYGYIGKDSILENLDVVKAVSDMQKDSVLQQYQTFVGSNDLVFSSDDGIVLMK